MRRALIVLLVAAGCATPDPPTPGSDAPPDPSAVGSFEDEADYRAQRRQTEAALREAVGDAAAVEAGECRVVPTSEQACGGPTTFAVYSARDPDAVEIERQAAHLVALDRQANGQFEYVSTCRAYDQPRPVLRGGRCVDPAE